MPEESGDILFERPPSGPTPEYVTRAHLSDEFFEDLLAKRYPSPEAQHRAAVMRARCAFYVPKPDVPPQPPEVLAEVVQLPTPARTEDLATDYVQLYHAS